MYIYVYKTIPTTQNIIKPLTKPTFQYDPSISLLYNITVSKLISISLHLTVKLDLLFSF